MESPVTTEVEVLYDARGAGRGHVARATAVLRRLDATALVLTTTTVVAPLVQYGIPWMAATGVDVGAVARQLRPRVVVLDFTGRVGGEPARSARQLGAKLVSVWRLGREPPMGADLVLVAEAQAAGEPTVPGVHCAPILVLDDDELMPAGDARGALGIAERPALLLGRPEDGGGALSRLVEEAGIATIETQMGPLHRFFNGVDGLIGTAGYNLFHEAKASGLPAVWVWRLGVPDQPLRCPEPVTDPERLRAWVATLPVRPDASARYVNGAWIAAEAIRNLLDA